MTSWYIKAVPVGSRDGSVLVGRSVMPMRWMTVEPAGATCLSGDAASWRELRDVDAICADSHLVPPIDPAAASPTVRRLCFDELELARACAAAADAARTDAVLSASQASEQDRSRLLRQMVVAITSLEERLQREAAASRREVVTLARTVATAMTFHQDADRLAEVEAMVEAMIAAAPRDAGLILELAPSNVEPMRVYLGELPVRLVGAALGPLDARLSWHDGWIEHIRAQLEASLDEALAGAAADEPDLEPR